MGGIDTCLHESNTLNPTISLEKRLPLYKLATQLQKKDFVFMPLKWFLGKKNFFRTSPFIHFLDYACAEWFIRLGVYYSWVDYNDRYRPKKEKNTDFFNPQHTRNSNSVHPQLSVKPVYFHEAFFLFVFEFFCHQAPLCWEQLRLLILTWIELRKRKQIASIQSQRRSQGSCSEYPLGTTCWKSSFLRWKTWVVRNWVTRTGGEELHVLRCAITPENRVEPTPPFWSGRPFWVPMFLHGWSLLT